MVLIEFKRAIKSIYLYISLILGAALCFYGLMDYFQFAAMKFDEKYIVNAFTAWFTAVANGSNSYILLIAPILCTLPYSWSLSEDIKSGYIKNIILRKDYKKYFKSKFIVNGVIGGAALVVPIILIFVVCCILYPAKLPNIPADSWGIVPYGILQNLYENNHPFICIFISFLQVFIFGFIWSSLALSFTFLYNNKLFIVVAPLIAYTSINIAFEFLHLTSLRLYQTLFSWIDHESIIVIIALSLIVFLSSTTICSIYNGEEQIF